MGLCLSTVLVPRFLSLASSQLVDRGLHSRTLDSPCHVVNKEAPGFLPGPVIQWMSSSNLHPN